MIIHPNLREGAVVRVVLVAPRVVVTEVAGGRAALGTHPKRDCLEKRRLQMSMYLSLSSKPIPIRPCILAASQVVPEPTNGSKTRSPAKLYSRINRSHSSVGYVNGCPSFLASRSAGICHTGSMSHLYSLGCFLRLWENFSGF